MRIVKASYEIIPIITPAVGFDMLRKIEKIARVCYKSEGKITDSSCLDFVARLIDRGHEAMIEHVSITVKFIIDRGVSHEIVRHRVASYAQESTRYCNYSTGELSFIEPCFLTPGTPLYSDWTAAMRFAEARYLCLLDEGATAQEARSVLPSSLKTELVMTANLREWRHFLRLRAADSAHPQMREVTRPLLSELRSAVPIIFDDLGEF